MANAEEVHSLHTLPTATAAHPCASAGRPASALVLGRYRLLERLGAGGFGIVWRARDERLDREVAVKRIVLAPGATPDRVTREALATARLAHPAIVALYEAAAEEDAFCLVSELVRGCTLARLIARGELTDDDVLAIGLALCDALEHAHERGVIHRDVKPQNVLVPDPPGALRSRPSSPTSAAPGSPARIRSPAPATSWARLPTWPPSRPRAARSARSATCTPARSCASRRSAGSTRCAAPPRRAPRGASAPSCRRCTSTAPTFPASSSPRSMLRSTRSRTARSAVRPARRARGRCRLAPALARLVRARGRRARPSRERVRSDRRGRHRRHAGRPAGDVAPSGAGPPPRRDRLAGGRLGARTPDAVGRRPRARPDARPAFPRTDPVAPTPARSAEPAADPVPCSRRRPPAPARASLRVPAGLLEGAGTERSRRRPVRARRLDPAGRARRGADGHLAVTVLPRLGWLAATIAVCAWLVAAHAPGSALCVAAASLPCRC